MGLQGLLCKSLGDSPAGEEVEGPFVGTYEGQGRKGVWPVWADSTKRFSLIPLRFEPSMDCSVP